MLYGRMPWLGPAMAAGGVEASALDTEAAGAAAFAVELDEAAQTEEGGDVVFALERAEHAREVAGGGDLGA